ncbi:hypothetical protein GIB67_010233, partial [Kingdonia uniflora]
TLPALRYRAEARSLNNEFSFAAINDTDSKAQWEPLAPTKEAQFSLKLEKQWFYFWGIYAGMSYKHTDFGDLERFLKSERFQDGLNYVRWAHAVKLFVGGREKIRFLLGTEKELAKSDPKYSLSERINVRIFQLSNEIRNFKQGTQTLGMYYARLRLSWEELSHYDSFIEWLASAPSENVPIPPTAVEIYVKIVEKTRSHRSPMPPISGIPSETSAMAAHFIYLAPPLVLHKLHIHHHLVFLRYQRLPVILASRGRSVIIVESHLSQTYHEGLLKLQSKEYGKARELLESVLKDPLISNAQVDGSATDGHLLQLRFLALKNLANVFLKQGSMYHECALGCYLQAVEIDSKDSVVWNQLGTLSCSMGSLSISRWAFEQGLSCSPNNWNCMEKLLEVLIAIGDEVACLSVAKLILRHWPSHSRALHVKNIIQELETVPFAPKGIDRLEPKHIRLTFPSKRKRTCELTCNWTAAKRFNQTREVHLSEISWAALVDSVLEIFPLMSERRSDLGVGFSHDNPVNSKENLDRCGDVRLSINLPSSSETIRCSKGKGLSVFQAGESVSPSDYSSGKSSNVKANEASCDEEYPQERRSSRLERLRSRKPGKDELDLARNKNLAKVVVQFLEPFVFSRSESLVHQDVLSNPSGDERKDVKKFVMEVSNNEGGYHMGNLLLEEVTCKNLPYQEYFVKFLDLEKLTRQRGRDRTTDCSLFLAELYYDFGLCSADESKQLDFFGEASYHLCKVIEVVAMDFPFDDSMLSNKSSFWVRFFWLSGCLSISSGDGAKAYKEFSKALELLIEKRDTHHPSCSISLPHRKLIKELTIERIQHEINLLKVDYILKNSICGMIDKEMHLECVNLLSSLLLSTKEVYLDLFLGEGCKVGEGVMSAELSALDILITACEKSKPLAVEVCFNCHRRKLQMLTVAAGMVECSEKRLNTKLLSKSTSFSDMEPGGSSGHLYHLVAEEVKAISEYASQIKDLIDQRGVSDKFTVPISTIGDVQALLLTVMCSTVGIFIYKKSFASETADQTDQLESRWFVDAVIAFCKIQHLHQSLPIKTQVELIVSIHDLLAEYGLCCAGQSGEGEEGTFLKLGIKHLLYLDAKLKSVVNISNKELESTRCDEQHPHSNKGNISVSELHLSTPLNVETGSVEEGKPVAIKQDFIGEIISKSISDHEDIDSKKAELGIDIALDQCFFCLYGLDLRSSDLSSEDDLAVHKNTSRGDYQTKDQCADVFQYILPFAKASSRSGLVKVRKVLKAIRKHFSQPPEDILGENPIDIFLNNPDLGEEKLCEEVGSDGFLQSITNIVFSGERNLEQWKTLTLRSSEPYSEVYSNLYYFLAQAEEISATDKCPGFVLNKEGENFVEQNANLFKYDLLYNPLRFTSWQQLATIYDEEVDLLLNDGSKHKNAVDWRKHHSLPQRVETRRRRSRRCLLMSLALATTPAQRTEIHELLALVYYDGLQNVVPIYDQLSVVPTKDAAWTLLCQNSMKHFEKAFALKPDWSHAFYLGKLCEKLGDSYAKAFCYYDKAISLNPSAVDPVYRMHASRLKLLYTHGKHNPDALKVVATYSFNQSIKATVMDKIDGISFSVPQPAKDIEEASDQSNSIEENHRDNHHLEEAWHMLYSDCLSALELCVEGELKHFHKARYMLAQGWYQKREFGDLERAKDKLSFCFKSSRSSYTINMWEIDGTVRKGRRKAAGLTGNKKALEVNLSESSRKFITCIRKYVLFYVKLLQETGDISTLDRAFVSLRADKRFSLCLEDLVLVVRGRYIQALMLSINQAESLCSADVSSSTEHLLEKMFSLFMDHWNAWTDISSLPDIKGPELTESNFYDYLHQFIHSLEKDLKLDILEGINEKIRKRFKNPKLSNSNCAKVCRHAFISWYRSIVISLVKITPLDSKSSSGSHVGSENTQLLCVDLQETELWNSVFENPAHLKYLENKWAHLVSNIKGIKVKQVREENVDTANSLLRCSHSFYRESSCGMLPPGINLYTIPCMLESEDPVEPGMDGVDIIDLSIPRKLLLWAYSLMHGRYLNILAVVKHCEENAKSKLKKASGTPLAPSQTTTPTPTITHTGGGKERVANAECDESQDNPQTMMIDAASLPESKGVGAASNVLSCSNDTQKHPFTAPELQQCSNTERSKSDVYNKGNNKEG